MATATQQARRRAIVRAATQDEAPASSSDRVTVLIPRDFQLTMDDGTIHHYKAGVDEMPEHHLNHWFSKAIGVKDVNEAKSE